MHALFVILATAICESFSYDESTVTVYKDVIAGRVASFVKVTDVNVAFFSEANTSTMWLMSCS